MQENREEVVSREQGTVVEEVLLPASSFCLPCYATSAAQSGRQTNTSPISPFPGINVEYACTLLPINSFWIPPAYQDDYLFFCIHETVHQVLNDTSIFLSIGQLLQSQYLDLYQALWIPKPSGFSRARLLRHFEQTQLSLDTVSTPLLLVHELMATSLTRVCVDTGILLMAAQLYVVCKLALEDDGKHSPEFYDNATIHSYCQKHGISFERGHLRRLDVTGSQLNELQESFHRLENESWLPIYGNQFNRYCRRALGDDFANIYGQLVEGWHNLIRALDQVDESEEVPGLQRLVSLWYRLAKYPLQGPFQFPKGFRWSLDARLAAAEEYILAKSSQPIERLRTLLAVLGETKLQASSPKEWLDHVVGELPEFERRGQVGTTARLSESAKAIWGSKGLSSLGDLFGWVFNDPLRSFLSFTSLPVFSAGDEVVGWWERQHVLGLEMTRQVALAKQGGGCLCGEEVRHICHIRRVLKELRGLDVCKHSEPRKLGTITTYDGSLRVEPAT